VSAIKAIETDIGPSLAGFSAHLWALRVPHRVFDTGEGRQVIVVGSESDARLVREHFQRWSEGTLDATEAKEAAPPGARPGFALLATLRGVPVTVGTVLLSLLATLLVYADDNLRLLHWLTFTDIQRAGGRILVDSATATYGRGEYWRLITPVFLHFGALHLVFNMLWTWELGRRLEQARGPATLLAVLLLTGGGGNIAQFLTDRDAMFGGMSGVIYGLLGYSWLWSRITGDPLLRLPTGLLGFMVGWLLLCMSGVVEALGFGAIANSAHAAGLAVGLALGLGAGLLYSRPESPEH
jgi:GlpG protein